MQCSTLPYQAEMIIECRDLCEVLYRSLYAEAINPANVGRISIDIELKNGKLILTICADTISHLRALINSFLYLLNAVYETIEKIKS